MTDTDPISELRAWSYGNNAREAATELLIRAHLADVEDPWIRHDHHWGIYAVDYTAVPYGRPGLTASQRAVLGELDHELDEEGRYRGRGQARYHVGRVHRDAGSEAPQPAAGAGSRSDAARSRLLRVARGQPKMMYPLVLDLAADGIAVAVACRVLGFTKQAFYAWTKRPFSDRDWDDAHLTNAAFDAHREDPTFGYRLLADELEQAGHVASERRVWRVCSEQRIWSLFAKKRGLTRKAGPPVHDDLVKRKFTADRLDQLWLTDITEHPTAEGKLYLCAIKDVYSNRIVGYSIDSRMKASLAVTALNNAMLRRGAAGTIVHSDRGSQFRSNKFVKALHRHELTGSIGRVGACADNAAMESFFALLQKNVLDRQRWATRQELRLAIITWIEGVYHRRRRQRGLGRITPIELETMKTTALAA